MKYAALDPAECRLAVIKVARSLSRYQKVQEETSMLSIRGSLKVALIAFHPLYHVIFDDVPDHRFQRIKS